jgi:hypothetical protein
MRTHDAFLAAGAVVGLFVAGCSATASLPSESDAIKQVTAADRFPGLYQGYGLGCRRPLTTAEADELAKVVRRKTFTVTDMRRVDLSTVEVLFKFQFGRVKLP